MGLNRIPVLRRGLLAIAGAAAGLGAMPQTAEAITFVYACLCCKQPGNIVVYKTGWINGDCDSLSTIPIVIDCDELFTAFTLPGSGGVGNGFQPAFDRAVTIGQPIVSSDGTTTTRIVMGTYPAADVFTPGSYSTRIFAIREGAPGTPNQFAPIDINMTGLSPLADSIMVGMVPGGEPITGLFDFIPSPVIAGGDVTVVIEAYRTADNCCPKHKCCIAVDFAALAWQNALPLPPACLGDCDRSGAVSFGDVTATLANFGQNYAIGVLNLGDANGDRTVNFADVTTILATFGTTCM